MVRDVARAFVWVFSFGLVSGEWAARIAYPQRHRDSLTRTREETQLRAQRGARNQLRLLLQDPSAAAVPSRFQGGDRGRGSSHRGSGEGCAASTNKPVKVD